MTDKLPEAMVKAALAAVDFDPDEDAVETLRTALAAALRVLAEDLKGDLDLYRTIDGRRIAELAARVERPAEEAY